MENPLQEERRIAKVTEEELQRSAESRKRPYDPNCIVDQTIRALDAEIPRARKGDPPFFGRVDYTEISVGLRETVYIGHQFHDGRVTVIHFGQPMARMFYCPDAPYRDRADSLYRSHGVRRMRWDGNHLAEVLDGIDRDEVVSFIEPHSSSPILERHREFPEETENIKETPIGVSKHDDFPENASSPRVTEAILDQSRESHEAQATDIANQEKRLDFFRRILENRLSGSRFRHFVDSIRPDQWETITQETNGECLVIEGPAGSGKTGCALTRAAYLHFRHENPHLFEDNPKTDFRKLRVLLASRSDELLDYVHSVLPDLGAAPPEKRTVSALRAAASHAIRTVLPRQFKAATSLSESSERAERTSVLRVAERIANSYRAVLQDGIRDLPKGALIGGTYRDTKNELRLMQVVGNTWRGIHDPFRSVNQNSLSVRKFFTRAEVTVRIDSELWFQQWALTADFDRFPDSIRERLEDGTVDCLKTPSVLAAVDEWFESARATVEKTRQVSLGSLIRNVGKSISPGDRNAYSLFLEAIENGFHPNDSLMIGVGWALATAFRRAGFPVPWRNSFDFDSFDHLIIDEGQELTRSDYLLLGLMFPGAQWTICGDRHQSNQSGAISGWSSVSETLNLRQTFSRLTTNYRSSSQINAVAQRLMPETVSLPSPVSGVAPRLHRLDGFTTERATTYIQNLLEQIMSLSSNSRTALLRVTEERLFHEHVIARLTGLKSAPRDRAESMLIGGHVTDVGGLEYDTAVVVVGPMSETGEVARRLYTAVTRARHDLHIIACCGTPDWFFKRLAGAVVEVSDQVSRTGPVEIRELWARLSAPNH